MHNFTPTYVSFFSLKMCKIDNFLYFAKFYMSVVALIFFFFKLANFHVQILIKIDVFFFKKKLEH